MVSRFRTIRLGHIGGVVGIYTIKQNMGFTNNVLHPIEKTTNPNEAYGPWILANHGRKARMMAPPWGLNRTKKIEPTKIGASTSRVPRKILQFASKKGSGGVKQNNSDHKTRMVGPSTFHLMQHPYRAGNSC
ncbi:hypothetical protein VNO78_11125 [Psophocarpus tetragonolobus]|uniref:Uncharacterized protein n=1 Tax=Psophocarpus tetragonolobus TaxID=3891 RepID=A0AAN9SSJ0_PSOTE